MPVFSLSIHADYRCGRSGACCTAGWPIGVEPDVRARLDAAREAGHLRIPGRAGGLAGEPPRDGSRRGPFVASGGAAGAVLATDARGYCVFYDAGNGPGCAIHAQLGHPHLPLACRQFPRVTLRDPRGVFVSLSHYCPTAARLLSRDDVELRVVAAPPAFPEDGEHQGLDATDAFPPLLRPGVLMDLAAYDLWERHAVEALSREDARPGAVLASLGRVLEAVRRWRPGGPSMRARLSDAIGGDDERGRGESTRRRADLAWADCAQAHRLVLAAVPAGVAIPDSLADAAFDPAPAAGRLVDPVWPSFGRAVCRYLAARTFGSWLAYQGGGLRTVLEGTRVALAVLKRQAAWHARVASRPLDLPLLIEAVRSADLLLVHLASPQDLADRLSVVES